MHYASAHGFHFFLGHRKRDFVRAKQIMTHVTKKFNTRDKECDTRDKKCDTHDAAFLNIFYIPFFPKKLLQFWWQIYFESRYCIGFLFTMWETLIYNNIYHMKLFKVVLHSL